jgi:fructoselysine-6-P-deglycase FrlB-like protein
VGSGGSFSTADFACFLHKELTQKVALPLTPIEAAGTGIDLRSQAVLLATAGGKNPDVLGAFRTVVAQEPRRFTVL